MAALFQMQREYFFELDVQDIAERGEVERVEVGRGLVGVEIKDALVFEFAAQPFEQE